MAEIEAIIRSTDIREKPSSWRCVKIQEKAFSKDAKMPVAALGALLAMTFYRVKQEGVWAFAGKKMAAMGLLDTLSYDFPWWERIRHGVVMKPADDLA